MQVESLHKYVPADMLQIPRRAETREDAARALRMCDRCEFRKKDDARCVHSSARVAVVECAQVWKAHTNTCGRGI